MKGRISLAAFALTALVAAGCGSSSSSSSASSAQRSSTQRPAAARTKACAASIGIEGPFTGQVAVLGQEQLAFAKLAVDDDNKANGTNITLVQGDTQLMPAQATTVTQQFISNSKIVGGGRTGGQPGGRGGRAAVRSRRHGVHHRLGDEPDAHRRRARTRRSSGWSRATTSRARRTRTTSSSTCSPKALMIVDDQEVYSTGLVSAMIPIFQKAGIKVDHESVSQKVTDFSSLVAKVTPQTTVVVLPWQVAANAQQFGKNLAEQHKKATIFGTDGTQSLSRSRSPARTSRRSARTSTRSRPMPRSRRRPRPRTRSTGRSGRRCSPPTHVIDEAIASVVQERPDAEPRQRAGAGQGRPARRRRSSVSRSSSTATATWSDAKWFLFKINDKGQYKLVTNS